MQVPNGSYPAPEQPVKQNQTNTKSCRQWEEDLFPMILVSGYTKFVLMFSTAPRLSSIHHSISTC